MDNFLPKTTGQYVDTMSPEKTGMIWWCQMFVKRTSYSWLNCNIYSQYIFQLYGNDKTKSCVSRGKRLRLILHYIAHWNSSNHLERLLSPHIWKKDSRPVHKKHSDRVWSQHVCQWHWLPVPSLRNTALSQMACTNYRGVFQHCLLLQSCSLMKHWNRFWKWSNIRKSQCLMTPFTKTTALDSIVMQTSGRDIIKWCRCLLWGSPNITRLNKNVTCFLYLRYGFKMLERLKFFSILTRWPLAAAVDPSATHPLYLLLHHVPKVLCWTEICCSPSDSESRALCIQKCHSWM